MKFLIFNRKIQLLGLLWVGMGCVSQDAYDELKEENKRLREEMTVQKGHHDRLIRYVDSIVPLLTLNRSSSVRDRIFPAVVKISEELQPTEESPSKQEPPEASDQDLEVIQALKGELATLNDEGELEALKVSQSVSVGGLRQELRQFHNFLWTHQGNTYKMILPQDRFFSYGRSSLQDGGRRILSVLARRFINLSEYDIYIETHTDDREASKGNSWELTSRRAAQLAAYLEAQGVSSENLVAAGRGHFDPYFLHSSESNRSHNRRIEFILMPKNNN